MWAFQQDSARWFCFILFSKVHVNVPLVKILLASVLKLARTTYCFYKNWFDRSKAALILKKTRAHYLSRCGGTMTLLGWDKTDWAALGERMEERCCFGLSPHGWFESLHLMYSLRDLCNWQEPEIHQNI